VAFQRKKPTAMGVKAPFPGFVEPALPSPIDEVSSGARWIHEIKFDGYRVQLHLVNEAVKVLRTYDKIGIGTTMSDMPDDPLAEFGLDAIDLRWTLKDIAAKRSWMINQAHLAKLIDLGLVEMRGDIPVLTVAGQNTVWC
jgi:hypothetical protein